MLLLLNNIKFRNRKCSYPFAAVLVACNGSILSEAGTNARTKFRTRGAIREHWDLQEVGLYAKLDLLLFCKHPVGSHNTQNAPSMVANNFGCILTVVFHSG